MSSVPERPRNVGENVREAQRTPRDLPHLSEYIEDFSHDFPDPTSIERDWLCDICHATKLKDFHQIDLCGHKFHSFCLFWRLISSEDLSRHKCPTCNRAFCLLPILSLDQEAKRRAEMSMEPYDNTLYEKLLRRIRTGFEAATADGANHTVIDVVERIAEIYDYFGRDQNGYVGPEHEQEGDIWLQYIAAAHLRQLVDVIAKPPMASLHDLNEIYHEIVSKLQGWAPDSSPAGSRASVTTASHIAMPTQDTVTDGSEQALPRNSHPPTPARVRSGTISIEPLRMYNSRYATLHDAMGVNGDWNGNVPSITEPSSPIDPHRWRDSVAPSSSSHNARSRVQDDDEVAPPEASPEITSSFGNTAFVPSSITPAHTSTRFGPDHLTENASRGNSVVGNNNSCVMWNNVRTTFNLGSDSGSVFSNFSGQMPEINTRGTEQSVRRPRSRRRSFWRPYRLPTARSSSVQSSSMRSRRDDARD